MSKNMSKVFWELHNNLLREGPGDNISTRKAFLMLKKLPKIPYILDIGCGPGMQTIELAKISCGKILAIDNHQPFLNQLKKRAKKEGVDKRIRTINSNIFTMDYEQASFDITWSEGAIYIIGFKKGLLKWKSWLKKTVT
jgi:ubiquinone/menaquinone biosynthesis C-methylase UbiE